MAADVISAGTGATCPSGGPGIQALRGDETAALFASAVPAFVEPDECPAKLLPGTPGRKQQCQHLLTLEGDGGALRIVLIVGVGGLGGRDDATVLELQSSDVDGVARQLLDQTLATFVHVERKHEGLARWRRNSPAGRDRRRNPV